MWRPRCPRRGGEPTEASTLLQPLSGFQLLLQTSHPALPGGWTCREPRPWRAVEVPAPMVQGSCWSPRSLGSGTGWVRVTVQLGHLHEGG